MLNVDLIIKSIEKAGHTLNGIEKSLGWGNGSIKRWHTSSPSIDKLFALSNFLNVSVCTLIGERSESSSDAIEISGRYDALDDDGRAVVRNAIIQEERRMRAEEAEKKGKNLTSSDGRVG